MNLLEERKDLLIILNDGKVETITKSPYTLLKHKFFQGKRVSYIAETGVALEETGEGFRCCVNAKAIIIPDKEKVAEAILYHWETKNMEKIHALWRLHYGLSLLRMTTGEGFRVDVTREGVLSLPKDLRISVAEWTTYHDGSTVAKVLVEQMDERSPMFRGSRRAVALLGRDELGQPWLHFLPLEYTNRSIAECELWLMGGQPEDQIIF